MGRSKALRLKWRRVSPPAAPHVCDARVLQPPLPFSLHQRKIDLNKNVTGMDGWHHEVVPRSRQNLRILAGTLSSQAQYDPGSRGSILDRVPPPSDRMRRHFEFATRAVSKMLFSRHAAPVTLLSPAFLSSPEFLKAVSETVAVAPRSTGLVSQPSAVLEAIAHLMAAGSGGRCAHGVSRMSSNWFTFCRGNVQANVSPRWPCGLFHEPGSRSRSCITF
jgi:hypothetical protein